MKKKKTSYRINGRFDYHPTLLLLKDRELGSNINLEPLMADVLSFLIENNNEVIPRIQLINRFWDTDTFGDEALTKVISKLRKVLDDEAAKPKFIKTLSKTGYQWIGKAEKSESNISRVTNRLQYFQFDRRTMTGLSLILLILIMIKSIFLPHH